jgi:hypothetical protein
MARKGGGNVRRFTVAEAGNSAAPSDMCIHCICLTHPRPYISVAFMGRRFLGLDLETGSLALSWRLKLFHKSSRRSMGQLQAAENPDFPL